MLHISASHEPPAVQASAHLPPVNSGPRRARASRQDPARGHRFSSPQWPQSASIGSASGSASGGGGCAGGAAAGAEPLAGSPHARRRWCRLRRRRKLPPPPAYRAGVFVLQPRRDAHQMEVVRALREGGSGERRVRAGAAGRACGRGSAPCPTPPESRHPGLRRLVRSRRAACGRCRRHRPRSSRSSWRPRASS